MINSTNYNLILFGTNSNRNRVQFSLNIKINNKDLVLVNEAINLGVIIDYDLRW